MKYYHGERSQDVDMIAALIKESAETGCPIITIARDTNRDITRMSNMVQYKQKNLPRPFSLQEVKDGGLRGRTLPGIIISDAQLVLMDLLHEYVKLPIEAIQFAHDVSHGDVDIEFGSFPDKTEDNDSTRDHRKILEKSVSDLAKKYEKLTSENKFGEAFQVLKNIEMTKKIIEMDK